MCSSDLPGGPVPLLGNSTISQSISTAVAFLANSSSTSAGFSYHWCGDSGCTRTISNHRSDFVTFEKKHIPIILAKQGAILDGQGVGDIIIHTRDNLGYPVTIREENSIWVPDGRRLLSLHTVSEKGFQPVMPAKDPHFPAGLYLPRDATGVQRYIPFVVQNSLCFIPSTERGPESRLAEIGRAHV